ncbi:MAG TPA: hypothetical protein VJI32_04100 [Candidatus Nanoarchaeia archaeon]|nr:hypothetical protein [Candidatus Nanoarchaeia archaeon]
MPRKTSQKKKLQKSAPSGAKAVEQDLTIVYIAGGLLVLLVLAQYLALF